MYGGLIRELCVDVNPKEMNSSYKNLTIDQLFLSGYFYMK